MSDADLTEIREGFREDDANWADIREARAADIRALTPDSTWDEKDRAAREEAGRPCLSFDELGQYVNQLVNDAREQKRAIEVNPAGDDSTDDVARFIGGLIRQIEYRSNAQLAYTQMFDDCASGSYGFFRIVPEFVQQKIAKPSLRSFDQELLIKPVHNPDLITPGYFTRPDFSDCTRFWVHESYSPAEFKRAYPKAKTQDFRGLDQAVGVAWWDGTRIMVREFWELKTRVRTLVLMPPPQPGAEPMAVWEDSIPEDKRDVLAGALKTRKVDEPYVCQTITNGFEVLEHREDWPGRYIPIVGCVGKVLWTDTERQILSLIRNAIGPQQLYNYYRTSEAEIVGMTPKVPWFYYDGTLDTVNEAALRTSNQVPVGAIKIKAQPEGWNPALGPVPFPSRQMYEPPIMALEAGAESTRRSIQSATGTGFLPTEAQRVNQKSGVALREIATSAAKGAYHFVDHYEHALRRAGVILVDLIPHYYDAPRTVHVRGADDSTEQVRINDQSAPAPKQYGGQPIILKPEYEFDVTISTGPGYATERDKASEFGDQLVSARPELFQILGPEIIALKNLGPIGDKMVELLKAMAPPQLQKLRNGDQPLPPEAQQAMMQLQQAQQMIQQLQRIIETEQIKGQAALAAKQLDGQIKLALAELQGRQKLELEAVKVAAAIDTREDEQVHEMAMAGAGAAVAASAAERMEARARLAASTAHLTGGGVRPAEDSAP
jgi:hypothetical protein